MYNIYFETEDNTLHYVKANTLESARLVHDALVYAGYMLLTERPH